MKRRTSILTAQVLRSLLSYNEESGVFHWINRVGNIRAGAIAGSKGPAGYIAICVMKERHGAHRLAWLYVHGVFPDGEIDHINGDKSDNRICNLRDVSHTQNTQNIRVAHRRNKSTGALGVCRSKTKSVRYYSTILVNGKAKCLGSYGTVEEAHSAYLKAKREFHQGCTI